MAVTQAPQDGDLPAVNSSQLYEQVYQSLRDGILRGRFAPGERLSAVHLATHFGISQTPVRAALARLEGDGLIEISPRRGTFVARCSEKDVHEVFQLRRIIECAALEHIDRLTEGTIARMEQIVTESASLVDGQRYRDYARYIQLDAEFHRLIVALLQNDRAIEIHEGLRWPLQLTRVVSVSGYHRAPDAVEEHTAILSALKARDATRARESVLRHLTNSESDLLSRLSVVYSQ